MRLIDADALRVDYFAPSSTSSTPNFYYVSEASIDNAPTIDAIPVEIIKHYKEMWKSRAQSGHFSDRIANGMMAQAAEIMLNYHEMEKSFCGGK